MEILLANRAKASESPREGSCKDQFQSPPHGQVRVQGLGYIKGAIEI